MHFSPSSGEQGDLAGRNGTALAGNVNRLVRYCRVYCRWAAVFLLTASVAPAQNNDPFVGIWVSDQGYQIMELLFRSDGVYQIDTRSTDPTSDFESTDLGRYQVTGQSLTLTSYGYFSVPGPEVYDFEITGNSLSLTSAESTVPEVFQFKPGSREDVLAREKANPALVRRWTRHLLFVGDEEFTFRPGGYYVLKTTRDDPRFPIEFERGRYQQAGNRITIEPYSGDPSHYEFDVFGSTLTLIETNDWSGQFTSYEEVPGSYEEVTAKAAEAQAFLSVSDWQAGVWRMQVKDNTIDLLLRPDGIYSATNTTPVLRRVLRGRYTLANEQIQLVPFVGQELYTLDEANFGIARQTYTLDYYDGELQLIDLSIHYKQSVTLAHQAEGSHGTVMQIAREAQAQRQQKGWHIGAWEAMSPAPWMEFTFRPDYHYIAKSGARGVPGEVERGRYVLAPGKITLAPHPGTGPARGFELDLYNGDLFLIGDSQQLVIVRKLAGSETGVIDKTVDPVSLKAERGSILGRWTANRPMEFVELVFRQDGQFRLKRCTNEVTSYDYGLYTVDIASRTLVYDSRVTPVQTRQLDFYGDTLTIHGGLSNTPPDTYTVNLGTVDAAIADSLTADAQETQVDVQWLARVPIAPRDPNAVQPPLPGIPTDPRPGQIIQAPAVFTTYQYYRRLIPHFLTYADGSLFGVIDTQQWHFFPTGRVLVRFTTYRAGWPAGMVIEDVTEIWGAYGIDPKPTQTDILHCYADNVLNLKTDMGEEVHMTLENGRRNLFWGKNGYALGVWATAHVPSPCQLPGMPDASLINTGLSLSTDISPDPIGQTGLLAIGIAAIAPGSITINGNTDAPRTLVLESATTLAPVIWRPLRSNNVPAGPFSFTISADTNPAAFFRVRTQ